MKRGWIMWDPEELPPAAFEARLAVVRNLLGERDLPALVVYTDIWRSNQGRRFSNFMPYWNRALLVIPREDAPLLLCGLSPRVYPWIRSVTILKDIVPSPNLAQQLLKTASDRGWSRIGVLGLEQLPFDLYQQIATGIEAIDVALPSGLDDSEFRLYRHAAKLSRVVLREEIPKGIGLTGHEFTGRLERRFRLLGAEDLVILLTNGLTAPRPAEASVLAEGFSVVLALEYRGHWVKMARCSVPVSLPAALVSFEDLAGPYPFEPGNCSSPVFAVHQEFRVNEFRRFHSDTYYRRSEGARLL